MFVSEALGKKSTFEIERVKNPFLGEYVFSLKIHPTGNGAESAIYVSMSESQLESLGEVIATYFDMQMMKELDAGVDNISALCDRLKP